MATIEYLPRTEFLRQTERATERYEARTRERQAIRKALDDRGVLHADAPDRVTKRLARLGASWPLATALERTPREATTGRSLAGLAPDSFGADVLALERLMGRNDLVDVGFLEAGSLAARSVGRVFVGGRGAHYGTGFLVSESLLLTNNHVLRDPEQAGRGLVRFNYQAGPDGRQLEPVEFDLEPARFFVTDRHLDFTLVAVAARSRHGEPLGAFGRLGLSEAQGKVILGELVNIVQHPGGEPKQLALRENEVVDLLDDFVQYGADTRQGSSGAPVFNDQWEVVALHHAGVPAKGADGRYLAVDGSVWTPEQGEERLAWKANEGVRISRILRAVREAAVSGSAPELRAQLLETPTGLPGPVGPPSPAGAGPTPAPAPEISGRSDSGDVVHVTVPLRIAVGIASAGPPSWAGPAPDGDRGAPSPSLPPAYGGPAYGPPTDGRVPYPERELQAALVNLEAGRDRPYYEAEADQAARQEYYASLPGVTGAPLRQALTDLLERTHERRPAYKPIMLLYPWVDLHPDLELRGIYSGESFSPEEFIRADAEAEAARFERWRELLVREAALGPDAVAAEMDALEDAVLFNCEHVVPQSWFAKREPMRGDLHHLFACGTTCNSFRGNFPYFDFADLQEAIRTSCGRRESQGFEPSAGKGPVARATFYFLLRYPGLIGDAPGELRRERLEMLLTWHESEAVGEYEHHRNAAIAEIQGDRNPLVDHPEWARDLDFEHAWPAA
ncbi:endonuclease [Streptomyces triculaminicus]|uniref:endonuclease n=1 Tax=Streptomyces triculaminicus TaxID=2816232 RepID=UPI0037D4506B